MAELNELPFEVEGPEVERTPIVAAEGKIPGYVEPWQRCANCDYFDGEAMCTKFKAPADMDGACPAFEKATEDDNAGEAEDES